MSNFYEILQQASVDVIDHMKEDVVAGDNTIIDAVFRQSNYLDEELGPQTYTGITVSLENAQLLRRGMRINARGKEYIIKNIPPSTDPWVDIELHKNA